MKKYDFLNINIDLENFHDTQETEDEETVESDEEKCGD